MSKLIDISTVDAQRIEKYSPAETLVRGNPHQIVEIYLELPEQGLKAGFWEGEEGAYRLEFGPGKVEHFAVLEGLLRVHNSDGTHADFKPGDTCVLPPGFTGVFEILVRARKQFVISERGATA
jgi:uncharacterized cupin superfamily protein